MVFKDRIDAGEKLAVLLEKKLPLSRDRAIVVSLLRGGIVVGDVIAKKLSLTHLPLVVTKIPAPYQPELAIGALCFDQTYWESSIVNSLNLTLPEKNDQRLIAKNKFTDYCRRFNIQEKDFLNIKNKTVVLVDDGIATGSTARAARLFLKSMQTKKIILASPVAPSDFKNDGFDEVIILHKDPYLSAISQFYQSFPQLEDEEVEIILSTPSPPLKR